MKCILSVRKCWRPKILQLLAIFYNSKSVAQVVLYGGWGGERVKKIFLLISSMHETVTYCLLDNNKRRTLQT